MNINEELQKIYARLSDTPRFLDGRLDYTNAYEAPAVNVFVSIKGKLLAVKRSEDVLHYKGLWHVVAGYLDDPNETIEDAARKEVREEIGVEEDGIIELVCVPPLLNRRGTDGFTWHIFPVYAKLRDDVTIKLDWEASTFALISPDEFLAHDHIPGIADALATVRKYF